MKKKTKPIAPESLTSDLWKKRQTDAEMDAAKRLMMTIKNGRGMYDLAYAKKLLERAVKEM